MAIVGLLIIAAFLIYLKLSNSCKKPANFPPGPPRLPVVGSLPYMRGDGESFSLFHGVNRAVNKYGKVLGFYLGGAPVAVISDFHVLTQVFKDNSVSSRPPIVPFNENRLGWNDPALKGGSVGIIMSDGEYWKEQRRFALRNLRDFGFGKSSMEDAIVAEAGKLCRSYEKLVGGGANSIHHTLSISVLNSLWAVLVGENLELDDPKLKSVVKAVNDVVRDQGPQSPLAAVLPNPRMIKLPILSDLSGFNLNKSMYDQVTTLIRSYVDEHVGSFDPHSCPRDFMDIYLKEISKTQDPWSSFHPARGHASLINMCVDLFVVGTETTSSALLWIVLYLLHHEDIQARIHYEIEKVVGSERDPKFSDRADMHFTNAVIHESLRHASFTFLGVPRFATAPLKIGDHEVPAGTTIFANLHHVMNDPEYWHEPRMYNPDRFINPETGEFVPDERFIPFSIGKRACLGKLLAEQELFLFTVKLLQRFSFSPHADHPLPSYDLMAICPKGITRPCPEFKAVLENRC